MKDLEMQASVEKDAGQNNRSVSCSKTAIQNRRSENEEYKIQDVENVYDRKNMWNRILRACACRR